MKITNKIYFYSSEAHYEYRIKHGDVPMLKIGKTLQEKAQDRINQQDTTSNPEKLDCKGVFETTFSDEEFHKYLLKRGYSKTRDDKNREWFFITVEDATYELEQFRGIKSVNKIAETRELYKHQQEFVSKILSNWEQWKEFLLFAKCRSGKSTMVLTAIVKRGVKVTLIVSRFKSPKQSWREDSNLKNFENLVFIDVNKRGYEKEVEKYLNTDKQIILWGCIQKQRKLTNLPCNVDLIVYDEAHEGYKRKQWNNLHEHHNCKVIYVTGTAYKLLFDFDENSKYCYSYFEEQLDKKLGLNNAPAMNLLTAEYQTEEYQKYFGDDPAALKNTFNTLPNGDFIHPSLVQEFVDMYFSSQRNLRPQDRIFKDSTHIYATLSSVAACHSFAKYLTGTRFSPLVVTGETKEDADSINAHIEKNPCGTIILTQRANVLGVTAPKIDTVINLTEGKSLEIYVQFAFRGGSGDKDWNLLDFCPERAIQSLSFAFDQACDANPSLAEYELLDFVGIFPWLNGFNKMTENQINDLLSSNVENTIDKMNGFVNFMDKSVLASIECGTNLKSLGNSFGRDPYSVNSNGTNSDGNKKRVNPINSSNDKKDNTTEIQVREYLKRIPLAIFYCIRKNVPTINVKNFLETPYYIHTTGDINGVMKNYFEKTSGRERERFQRYLRQITSNIKSSIDKDECLTLDKLSHSGQHHKVLPLNLIDSMFSS